MTTTAPAPPTAEAPGTESNGVILSFSNGVALRPLRPADAVVYGRAANNKKIWDNLRNRMPHPYTEADAVSWISFTNDKANHVKSGRWTAETGSQGPALHTGYAITVDDVAVGSIGLAFGQSHDIYFRNAELGYWLSEDHWGKGIMGMVVPAFIDWAWRTFEVLVRVEAEAYEMNAGSRRVLEKAGMVIEGRKKNALVKNGVFINSVWYGILRPGMG